MWKFVGCLVASLVMAGCAPPNVQQHAGFRRATVAPSTIEGTVGQLVAFKVLPPVARGTQWSLESHGLARFVGDDTGRIDWVADTTPIHMEAVVAPWGPDKNAPSGGRGWLWFGMGEGASTEPLDVDLPVHPLPYREIAPVTYGFEFSLLPRKTRLSFEKTADRVKVIYRTPVGSGVPVAPRIGATLIETGGKKILYAEVKTNFGDRAKEPIGYEVTFSYALSVADPVEVVVVEWTGYGIYYGPFDLHRLVIGAPGAPPSAPSAPSAPPSTSAAPPSASAAPAAPAPPPPASVAPPAP